MNPDRLFEVVFGVAVAAALVLQQRACDGVELALDRAFRAQLGVLEQSNEHQRDGGPLARFAPGPSG
ncbi:MAG TPA: hypothetical protein VNC12_03340 [Solirubrobacteraceae bacterium]|nr:hypothetical protein [Solirubrobacteraceae bacterium]